MSIVTRQKIATNSRRAVEVIDNIINVQDLEEISIAPFLTFTDGDVTPDVSGGFIFQTANTIEVIITNFDGAKGNGHKITVYFGDDLTTIKHNITKLLLEDGVDKQMYEDDIMEFLYVDGLWYGWTGKYT